MRLWEKFAVCNFIFSIAVAKWLNHGIKSSRKKKESKVPAMYYIHLQQEMNLE